MSKVEMIEGTEYEVGSPPHTAATKRRDDSEQKGKKAIAGLKLQLETEKKRADAATEQLKEAAKKLKEATSPKRLDHLVKIRAAVSKYAKKVIGPTFKTDGLSAREMRLAILKHHYPHARLDSKDATALRERWAEFREEMKDPRNARKDAAIQPRAAKPIPEHLRQPPPEFKADTFDELRRKRNDAEEDRHRRPLAMTKSNPHREMDGLASVQGSMLETMK